MRLVEEVGKDLRFAARVLVRTPGFTLAAVVSLAIGIGVTTFLFTNLQSTVFREIPGVTEAASLGSVTAPITLQHLRAFSR